MLFIGGGRGDEASGGGGTPAKGASIEQPEAELSDDDIPF
jgi:hypothetical protein